MIQPDEDQMKRHYYENYTEKLKLSEKKSVYLVSFGRSIKNSKYPQAAVLKITERKYEVKKRKYIQSLEINLTANLLFSYKKNSRYYIFTEYYEKGTLREFLQTNQKTSRKTLIQIFIIISLNLNNYHENSIYNLGISPDNIYLTKNNNAKIDEFNSCFIEGFKNKKNLLVWDEYSSPNYDKLYLRHTEGTLNIQDLIYEDRFRLGKMMFECLIKKFNLNLKNFSYEDIARYFSTNLEKHKYENQLCRIIIEFIKPKKESFNSLKELATSLSEINSKANVLLKDDVKLGESVSLLKNSNYKCRILELCPNISILMSSITFSKLSREDINNEYIKSNIPHTESNPELYRMNDEQSSNIIDSDNKFPAIENNFEEEIKNDRRLENATYERVNIEPNNYKNVIRNQFSSLIQTVQPRRTKTVKLVANCIVCGKPHPCTMLSCKHQIHLSCFESKLAKKELEISESSNSFSCFKCFKIIKLSEHPALEKLNRNMKIS